MSELTFAQAIAVGFALGALLAWLFVWLLLRQKHAASLATTEAELAVAREAAGRLQEVERKETAAREEVMRLREQLAALEAQRTEERRSAEEKLALLENAQAKLREAFQALSAEALTRNNRSFLDLARETLEKFHSGAQADLEKRQTAIDQLVKPVQDSLEKVGVRIGEIEKARVGAYESITAQLRMMSDAQAQLRGETANLVRALRSPIARGRWGEIQLRRVVEMAGMLEHCDFHEQESVSTETGRLRPDLLVRLPGGKHIVVDAKAPLQAYLEAIEAQEDGVRRERMIAHAAQVRAHIDALTRKSYWEQFPSAPEFVVLFLPGETFFGAALEHDPALIEHGADKKVILATPTTLIALLRAVFYGWRQERLARNAQEICELGRELYSRLATMGGHLEKLGRNLDRAVDSYNSAVRSMESRVLVSARKFHALEAAPREADLPELAQVDHVTQQLQAPELSREGGAADAERREEA